MDCHTREALATFARTNFRAYQVVEELDRIARLRGKPRSIRVDNGPEFAGRLLDQWAYLNKVELDFSRPGKPTDNAFIEAFNSRLRQECLKPQLSADMAFGKPHGFCQIGNRIEFTSFYAPPPAPRPADGAQDMRILRPVFTWQIGCGRHDLRPPVLLADLERYEDLDGLFGFHHSAATFFRGAIMSRMTPETPSVRTSITDQQLRLYMTDLQNHSQRTSAARAGFSERSARRFDVDPTPPSKRKIVRGRTASNKNARAEAPATTNTDNQNEGEL